MAQTATTLDIPISQEADVSVQRFDGKGEQLLLWLPSESGFLDQEKVAAKSLQQQGVSVWFADLIGAYFLPTLATSIEQLPPADVGKLIEEVRKRTGKQVYLVANGRGALLALRAAYAWQQQHPQKKLGGIILISPKLFVETPEPGQAGELMPVVQQTNQPIFIIQPANSPWRWKLDRMIPALSDSGSDVYARVLPKIRDRFYYRPDATELEDQYAKRMAEFLGQSVNLLQAYNQQSRAPTQAAEKITARVTSAKKERVLRDYQGDPNPPALQLPGFDGKSYALDQYRGKVVLVNFWASWCPPCVHEMPSMQRLADRFGQESFEILAVNMAEDRKTIQTFLQNKVKVQFPILMDSDGDALKRWQVFAFPTSYVIGKQGKIRLALFGAIDWEQTDVIEKITQLINE